MSPDRSALQMALGPDSDLPLRTMKRESELCGLISVTLLVLLTASGCEPYSDDYSRSRRQSYRSGSSSARPAPQGDEAVYDATNAVWDSNDRAYEETKRKAAAGDPEAQRWMQQYGALYESTRNWSRSKNEEWNGPHNQ
jgi:hypothetical protein